MNADKIETWGLAENFHGWSERVSQARKQNGYPQIEAFELAKQFTTGCSILLHNFDKITLHWRVSISLVTVVEFVSVSSEIH